MSSGVKKYGTTDTEENAEEVLACRQIIQNINTFGVNEKQKLKLIYLLAMELENRDQMQQITGLVKRLESGEAKKSTLILK